MLFNLFTLQFEGVPAQRVHKEQRREKDLPGMNSRECNFQILDFLNSFFPMFAPAGAQKLPKHDRDRG